VPDCGLIVSQFMPSVVVALTVKLPAELVLPSVTCIDCCVTVLPEFGSVSATCVGATFKAGGLVTISVTGIMIGLLRDGDVIVIVPA
jgi:hypothetical protein